LDIAIYDLMGNVIFQEKINTRISQKQLTIDTSTLLNGAYALTVKDYWKKTSLKFIKVKGN
ncbi:T9SS type A sorting domain-containing protein, partial [Salibacteraceae bacterium]|nr:T9SS type A sorting domain-containing protein [Salibacteraceae bacterium]